MNEEEKNIIRSNLINLLLHTNCEADLLTFFQQNEILSIQDIESIAAKNEGTPRAEEFYKIIQTKTSAFPVLLKGLRKYKQFKAHEILTGNVEGTLSLSEEEMRSRVKSLFRDVLGKSGISYNYNPPVHLFTGRTKELAELHEMVEKSKEGNRITVISQLTTVSGLGGIGKTQLARQYIQERRDEFDDNIVWLNAESQHTLSDSFRSLATQKLNLLTKDANGNEKSGNAIAEDVYKYFEGSRALFVLDNADNSGVGAATPVSSSWLYDFLPNPERNPDLYTIITSRNTEWGIGMKIIKLDVFTKVEAMTMIKLGLDIEQNDDNDNDLILKLAETLEYFPLALHQAISYIYVQRQTSVEYSIETYISEFRSTKKEVMLSYRDADSLDDTYMLTSTTTWKITVDKIAAQPRFGKYAIFLLKCMSYYNPSNINRDLFYEPFNEALQESVSIKTETKKLATEMANASMRLLVKYSMVNSLAKNQSILSIHPLVQTVTRLQLEKCKDEDPYIVAAGCLVTFGNDNREAFLFKNVEHCKSIWRHSRKEHIRFVRKLALEVSGTLLKSGRLDEVISLCEEILIKHNEVFGEADVYYFKFKQLTAVTLDVKGCKNEAMKLLSELLEKARTTFGEESEIFQSINLQLIQLKNNLGSDQSMSLQTLRNTFEWSKTKLGVANKSTLHTQRTLATQLMDKELYDEAFQIFTDFVKKHETVCESDSDTDNQSVSLLLGETEIAKIYFKQERMEEALTLFESIYQKFLQIWHKSSFHFIGFCADYARVLSEVGKNEEALAILENCYKMLNNVYGNKHWPTLILQGLIGTTQVLLGRFKEALATHNEALEIAKIIFGEKPQNLWIYKKLRATNLLLLGKIDESVCLLMEVQNEMDVLQVFDPKMIKLALSFTKTGNNLEALKLLVKIINSLQSGNKDNSEVLKELFEEVNSIIHKIKLEEEMIKTWKFALQDATSFSEAFSKLNNSQIGHGSYLKANPELFFLNNLFSARLLLVFKRFEEALRILYFSQNSIEKYQMINQKQSIHTLITIGDAYFGMRNYQQALAHHKSAFEKLSYIHGDLHVATIETKIRIATDLFCKEEQDDSLSMFENIAGALMELDGNHRNDIKSILSVIEFAITTFTTLFKEGDHCYGQSMAAVEETQENSDLNKQMNIAEGLITKGNYEEALKVYKYVYRQGDSPIWKADIGEAASACKNLAHVLNQLGKHKEALEILEGNLELVKLNLGSENHWIYLLQGSIANAFRGHGNLQEALMLHEGAYQGMRITLDEDHEELLILKKEIAMDLSLLGRHEESLCLFLEVLDKLETVSDEESYEVILAKIEYVEAIERSNESLQDALEILENMTKVMGEAFIKQAWLFQRVTKIMSRIRENLTLSKVCFPAK